MNFGVKFTSNGIEFIDGKEHIIRDKKGKSIIDFPKEFVLIDIETTGLDPQYDEIIEFAAIKIVNDKVIDTYQTLIKPNELIDEYITELTGITNNMVKNSPKVAEILPSIKKFISDFDIIGHNINFDINFLYDNFEKNGFEYLNNNYVDTLRISRKILPELKHHRLKDMIEYYKIESNGYHRALKDVLMTYELYKILKEKAISEYGNVDNFKKTFNRHHSSIDFTEIKSNVEYIDESNLFFGKYVAITGTLERMQRKDAMQLLANLGAICQNGVNKDTNFLILGNNDYNPILRGSKSSKQEKAEQLKLKGYDIEIITENIMYEVIDEYLKQ